ncbi:TPA_asm: hypothetical protein GEV19_02990 [Listeria monocytogenes]|nr:hypothetical protein [Listeria monocytogenes]
MVRKYDLVMASMRSFNKASNELRKELASKNFDNMDKEASKKYVFHSIKFIGLLNKAETSSDILEKQYDLIITIIMEVKEIISRMTPREFMNLFPIEKDFKGHKYETKDYFYTKDMIAGIGENNLIGSSVDEFLWDYVNWEIRFYLLASMNVIDTFLHVMNKKGFTDVFLEKTSLEVFQSFDFGTGIKHLIGDKGTLHMVKDGVIISTTNGGNQL